MEVVLVGLNHKAAPVEVRERLAFDLAEQSEVRTQLRRCVSESVILCTCNRTEVYAVVTDGVVGISEIGALLGAFGDLASGQFERYLYHLKGTAAVEHLFTVAAGLDSLIVGEPQILGQVRSAYEAAAAAGDAGRLLRRLFHHALHCGKRVRAETSIARNAVSVSYAAVELARRVIGELSGRTVLLVGAGRMAELAAQTLVANGVTGAIVTNRTYSRATQLADRFNGRAAAFALLPSLLTEADVVISSTGASGFVLSYDLVSQAMHDRRDRPLLLVDIAVPRDIDPRVRRVDGVSLYDIDDLQGVCITNMEKRRGESARAEQIILEQAEAFDAWRRGRRAAPTITALRRRAEEIRQAELRKALGRLEGLSERELMTVEALTTRIVNKILHEPTVRLKQNGGSLDNADYLRAVHDLFALEEVPR